MTKKKEPSCLKYWDVNNLYGWAMSQKLPLNDFIWVEDISEFNEDIIKSYNKESDGGYFLEIDGQYPKNLRNLYNDLLFLPERIKTKKVEKLVGDLHDKTKKYVIHIRNLKRVLNHGLVLKKVHTIIKFNEKVWLKPYIDMNRDLRKKDKNDFD